MALYIRELSTTQVPITNPYSRNIPFDELDANQEKLNKLKSKAILAVCDAGVNSNRAVASLRKSGMESVYGLKGGITAWTTANLPLVTGKKTKGKKLQNG